MYTFRPIKYYCRWFNDFLQTSFMTLVTGVQTISNISLSASTKRRNWASGTRNNRLTSSSGQLKTKTRPSTLRWVNLSYKGELSLPRRPFSIKISYSSDVATLFMPCLTAIIEAIQQQKAASLVPVTVSSFILIFTTLTVFKAVMLVGGFAASDWLFSNLQSHLERHDLRFSRPDGHLYVHYQFKYSILRNAWI